MKKNFLKRLRSQKGAILVEVLISLLIFVVGTTGTLALLVHSATINSINKNRIIAANLAREGIEVVKNTRDTNWLISSANIRACWNFSPDTNEDGAIDSEDSPCTAEDGQNRHPLGTTGMDSGNKKRVRSFLADFDAENARWVLLPAPNRLTDDELGFANYTSTDLNGEQGPVSSTDGRTLQLYVTADGRYTHLPTGASISPYSRVLEIYYIDNPDEDELFPDAKRIAPSEAAWRDNRIKVISRVYWKNTPNEIGYKTLSLETILTDYIDRENWSD